MDKLNCSKAMIFSQNTKIWKKTAADIAPRWVSGVAVTWDHLKFKNPIRERQKGFDGYIWRFERRLTIFFKVERKSTKHLRYNS